MMSEFPIEPQMAKMVVSSSGFGCSNEVISIASMLSVPCVQLRSRLRRKKGCMMQFSHLDGDHLTMLNIYHSWRKNYPGYDWCYSHDLCFKSLKNGDLVRQQIARLCTRIGLLLCSNDLYFSGPEFYLRIRKSIMSGFFMQMAFLHGSGNYLTVKERQLVYMHPASSMIRRPL